LILRLRDFEICSNNTTWHPQSFKNCNETCIYRNPKIQKSAINK